MKRIISIFLFLSILVSVQAQIRKIPSEVTESFKGLYPAATNVEWKDKIASFAAIFELDGKKHEAKFKENGAWQSTETALEVNQLPGEVNDGLAKSKYGEWELEKAIKIELPGNKVQYKLQVAKSDINKKNLLFNSNGKLVKDNRTL